MIDSENESIVATYTIFTDRGDPQWSWGTLMKIVLVVVLVLVLDSKLPSTTTRTRTSDLGPDGAGPSTIFIPPSAAQRNEWLHWKEATTPWSQ